MKEIPYFNNANKYYLYEVKLINCIIKTKFVSHFDIISKLNEIN